MYVDDTLPFCQDQQDHIVNLKLLLYCYKFAFGLKINFHKSAVYLLENDEMRQSHLAASLNYKVSSFLLMYLGIPIRPGELLRNDWHGLLSKIEKKLASWKGVVLSRDGKLVLMNAVLTAMSQRLCLFIFSLFIKPKWVLVNISQFRRKFFVERK